MKLVNMTPHAIVLQAADGTRTTVPPSGKVARVSSTSGTLATVEGIPVPVGGRAAYGEVEGLPSFLPDDSLCIVSGIVLAALRAKFDSQGDQVQPHWIDLYVAPGTGPNDGVIRNDKGQIEAVTRLVRG